MKIVKLKLSTASSDIMNTTSQALCYTFEFGSSWYLPIYTVCVNIRLQRTRNMEFVRVWVGRLVFLELWDLTTSQFVVLLLWDFFFSWKKWKKIRSIFMFLLLTFGLRSSSLGAAGAAAAAVVEVETAAATGALLALAASLALCFSRRLSSLSSINPINFFFSQKVKKNFNHWLLRDHFSSNRILMSACRGWACTFWCHISITIWRVVSWRSEKR